MSPTPANTYLLVGGGRAAVLAQAGPWSDYPDGVTTVHTTASRETADRWLAELRAGRLPRVADDDPRLEPEDPGRPIGGVAEAQPTARY